MSRKLFARAHNYGSASAKRASSSSYSRQNRGPFGPGMAQDLFGLHDGDDIECADDGDEVSFYPQSELDEEDLYDGVLQSFHFRHQGTLDIETNEEREARLRNAIHRFESSYNKMSLYALKWAYLMGECQHDPQLEKMFKDIQMLRKLKGSDCV